MTQTSPDHQNVTALLDKAIITVCSTKFFPSALNLIGSIRNFHPDLPIFVYDIGLLPNYRAELASMPGITICEVPQETPYWRACYTWKASIFKKPFAKLNFYLDAGNQVLRPLDDMFAMIDSQGYLVVEQEAPIKHITPPDYVDIFGIPENILEEKAITAGIFGFKHDDAHINAVIDKLHQASIAGLCLGFSPIDKWKNKGVNKTQFIRNCRIFRHDTTLFSFLMRMYIPNIQVQNVEQFGGTSKDSHPQQFLWNMRMNYNDLEYDDLAHSLASSASAVTVNRLLIGAFVSAKRTRLKLKNNFALIPRDPYIKAFGQELMFMDEYHAYPRNSNVRYYHRKKAYVVNEFLSQYAKPLFPDQKEEIGKMTFMDAGAGTGPYSKIAQPIFGHTYVYEYDAKELDTARHNLDGLDNLEFGQVDLKAIPLADAVVDVIVCSEVLEHIPEEKKAAEELFRVLKPGGSMLFSMPNATSLFYMNVKRGLKELRAKPMDSLPYPDWERMRHISFPAKNIEKLLTDAGFSIIARTGVNVIPLPTSLRKYLESNAAFVFNFFVKFDRLLGRIVPGFGSFYFLTVIKRDPSHPTRRGEIYIPGYELAKR